MDWCRKATSHCLSRSRPGIYRHVTSRGTTGYRLWTFQRKRGCVTWFWRNTCHIEARIYVKNEDVVGAAPTGDAPTTVHLSGNWSKRRQTETSTTKTSTNLNADKPKRRQTETSTDQNVDKPKRRQTKTSTNRNVDKPKRRQTKTSTNQNVDRPKRRQAKTSTQQNVDKPKCRHSILLCWILWCSRIFVFIFRGMYCMYIRT